MMKNSCITITVIAFLGIHLQSPPLVEQSIVFEREKLSSHNCCQTEPLWLHAAIATIETQSGATVQNKKCWLFRTLFSTSICVGSIFWGNDNIVVGIAEVDHRVAVHIQSKIIIESIIANMIQMYFRSINLKPISYA
ncbi:MAG: hypothetical protein ACP5PS_09380 [Bacteroidales bacterium]